MKRKQKKRGGRSEEEKRKIYKKIFLLYTNVIVPQPPGPSLRFKSNLPERLALYGPNDLAEVSLHRKDKEGMKRNIITRLRRRRAPRPGRAGGRAGVS